MRIENQALDARQLKALGNDYGIIKDVTFIYCNLTEGQFIFENCRFLQSKLAGHRLFNCKCSKAMEKDDAYYDSEGQLIQTHLQNVSLGNCSVSRVTAENCQFFGGKVLHSNLSQCQFQSTEIKASLTCMSQLHQSTVHRANSIYHSQIKSSDFSDSKDSIAFNCYIEGSQAERGIRLYRTRLFDCDMRGDVCQDVQWLEQAEMIAEQKPKLRAELQACITH